MAEDGGGLEMAKYHIYGDDKKYLGSLSCQAQDIVQRRLCVSSELYIKVNFGKQTAKKKKTKACVKTLPFVEATHE